MSHKFIRSAAYGVWHIPAPKGAPISAVFEEFTVKVREHYVAFGGRVSALVALTMEEVPAFILMVYIEPIELSPVETLYRELQAHAGQLKNAGLGPLEAMHEMMRAGVIERISDLGPAVVAFGERWAGAFGKRLNGATELCVSHVDGMATTAKLFEQLGDKLDDLSSEARHFVLSAPAFAGLLGIAESFEKGGLGKVVAFIGDRSDLALFAPPEELRATCFPNIRHIFEEGDRA